MKKFITLGIIIFSLAVVFLPAMTVWGAEPLSGGLVPCGNGVDDPCTLCHFIVGFHNLVTFMLNLVVVVALAGITIAGVMYVISAGSETMMTTAKGFLKASVVGFLVVLGSFLIVTITMWLFSVKTATDDPDGPGFAGIKKAGWTSFECSTVSTAIDSTPADPIVTCGINDIGECKAGVMIGDCPSGWTATTGNPLKSCASGTKCCVRSGESPETCSNSVGSTGKCFNGMSSCPSSHNHVLFAVCTASQSICCSEKLSK